MDDLTQRTAEQLLALYRTGQASPVEVTQQVLQRISRLNPLLNAFCWVDENAAMASAQRSEQRWQAHRQHGSAVGGLEGVPVSIKDLILTKGWPTLRGSRTVNPDQAWEVDAPVTARLREAGAVLLGKTTTPEFGCKGETNSLLTGISRNPWNTEHTPGGSSGGASAAVSAGLGPLAVGTDGAGSVRIPAAFCGNVGMKPSFGRVPAYPLSPFGSVAHLGPHAMSVADVALMMNTITAPDARDWTALPFDPVDYTASLHQGVKGLRVAYSPTLGYAKNVHPDIAAAVEKAALYLKQLGAYVEQTDPGIEDLILTPSTAVPAFPARPAGHSPMDSAAMLGWTPFSYPFNLSQQPAISLPCGLTREGLPMGVQLVGPMFGDALVLRAAKALESCHDCLRPSLGVGQVPAPVSGA
jgi:aspartyl-tRNA(Asn)/glutamyl-tRNA(Gln) amidotransferase subunit A